MVIAALTVSVYLAVFTTQPSIIDSTVKEYVPAEGGVPVMAQEVVLRVRTAGREA